MTETHWAGTRHLCQSCARRLVNSLEALGSWRRGVFPALGAGCPALDRQVAVAPGQTRPFGDAPWSPQASKRRQRSDFCPRPSESPAPPVAAHQGSAHTPASAERASVSVTGEPLGLWPRGAGFYPHEPILLDAYCKAAFSSEERQQEKTLASLCPLMQPPSPAKLPFLLPCAPLEARDPW